MGHIFISYSRKDEEYVNKLVDALENEGFEVWIDRELLTGDTWTQVINHKIDTCDAFVVMTDSSKESKWVNREVLYALQEGKKIFPLLLQGKLWMLLQDFNYFKVTDGLTPDKKFFKDIEKTVPRSEVWLKTQREAAKKAAHEKALLEKEKKDREESERKRKAIELHQKQAREAKEKVKREIEKKEEKSTTVKPKAGGQIAYWFGGFVVLVLGIVLFSSLNNPLQTAEPTPTNDQIQNLPTSTDVVSVDLVTPSETVQPNQTSTKVGTSIAANDALSRLEEINIDNVERISEINRWKIDDYLSSVWWAPDSKKIVIDYLYETDISYYDLDGNVVALPNTKDIGVIGFSGDGKLIGAADWFGEKNIKLYNNLLVNADYQTLAGHTQGINAIEVSADGELLVSGSSDNTVRVWRISDGALIRTFIGHEGDVGEVAISPNNNIVASSSEDCTIRLWDIPNDKLLSTIELQNCVSRPVEFSPDGSILASYEKTLSWGMEVVGLWRVDDSSLIKTLECTFDFGDPLLKFSPNGQFLTISPCHPDFDLLSVQSEELINASVGSNTRPLAKVKIS